MSIVDRLGAPVRRFAGSGAAATIRRAHEREGGATELRASLPTIGNFKFELAILAMLVATFLAVRFEDAFLTKTITFSPDSGNYTPYLYSDVDQGGNSRIKGDPKQRLAWTCDVREGVEFPFCGYELLLDGERATNGIDLSDAKSLTVDMSYDGPAELVRLSLKNYDPRYSEPGVRDTTKYNKVDFTPRRGRQRVELQMSEFGVAEWWLVFRKIPPELSKPQLDNVISLDIGPVFTSGTGVHRLQVHRITIGSKIISQAQWYLLILACWALLMSAYLVHRALSFRREADEKHRLQVEEGKRLEAARHAAESASRAKSEFLSSMSHELRTPLNAILGYTQLLKREPLTDRQAAAISTIHSSGTHLLTLITDVLDLAKIEAGRLELCPGALDPTALVRDVAAMMKVPAEQRGLRFACEMPGDLPAAVIGDDKRMRQVLLNLLGNAVKFTSEGEVMLRVALLSSDRRWARFRFEVSDTGPGIPADKLASIFKPFEQAGDSKGKAAGTGLGLSISRQLVRLMSGSLQVESLEGKGSRFWFELELPLAARSSKAEPDEPLVTGYSGPRRRVLVVDDTETNRALLRDQLDRLGFDVIEAADGAEAVSAATDLLPNLIFMDLRMPGMDGFEATRQLRAVEAVRNVPIIAVSASTTEEDAARALAAGANAFLPKPVIEQELLHLLVRMADVEWLTEQQPEKAESAVAAEMAVPDRTELNLLLDLARAGNMRSIREQAERILALDEKYRPFAQELKQLAARYQSPAILDMIREHAQPHHTG